LKKEEDNAGHRPRLCGASFVMQVKKEEDTAGHRPRLGGASFVMQVKKEEDNAGHGPRLCEALNLDDMISIIFSIY